MKSKAFSAFAVLTGTTIGAGFLGIPYVISKTGFIPGIFLLIFIGLFMLFMKLYLGEICLRTNGRHQLTGYAEKYLGKAGKFFMFFSMIFGLYSALVAYLIAEGESFSYLIFGNLSYSLVFSLVFWLFLTILTFIGLKALKRYENIAAIFVFILIGLLFVLFLPKIDYSNLFYINISNIFVPVGVILFSFLAFSSMPEIERILLGQEKKMKKVIVFGVLVPLIIYIIFTFVVLGVFGSGVSEIATLSLGRGFSILAILTMFTAYFVQSIAVRDMFRFDFRFGRFFGWILAVFVPLVLFLLIYFFRLVGFVSILGIAGVVSGGLTGILILLMNIRAKILGNRKPEYSVGINWFIILVLSILFILGVIFEIVW